MPDPVREPTDEDEDLRDRLARRIIERAHDRASHVYTP
jgi:hypothetical protein